MAGRKARRGSRAVAPHHATASGPVTLVQQTSASVATPATSSVITAAAATGHLLVLFVARPGGATGSPLTGVTDSAAQTWTLAGTSAAPATHDTYLECWYMSSAANITSVTMNSAASDLFAYNLTEWSGMAASAPLDVATGANSASGLTHTTPAVTTTADGDLVIDACQAVYSPTTTDTGSGFTDLTQWLNGVTGRGVASYVVAGAAGSYGAVTWTASASHSASVLTAAFKSGGGGGPDTSGVTISGTSIKKNGVVWQPRGGAIPIWTMGTVSKTVQGINLALNMGADIVRFTDYLNTNGVAGVAEYDEAQWVQLDLAIAKASAAGLYIELDFAAYRNLLINQTANYNPYDATALTNGWHPFLTWAANRVNTITGNTYKTEPMIVLVSFAGETDPPGSTVGLAHGYSGAQLIAFYDDVMTFWKTLAPKHLRIPGGLFHFSDASLPWQSIFSLASCDLPATHEYSGSDESYEPAMQTLATSLGKPWIVEEFGIVLANYANDTVRAADFTRQYNVALSNSADGILVWGMDPTALDPIRDPLTLAAVRAVSNVTHSGGTYRYFRISFSAVRTPGNNLQISEWTLLNGATPVAGMLVTATNTSGNSYESPISASDLDTSSKWNNASGVPCALIYDLGWTTVVNGYRITTANDNTIRDPAAWVVAGSTDGTTWTTLDTQAAPTVPLGRLTNTAVFPI